MINIDFATLNAVATFVGYVVVVGFAGWVVLKIKDAIIKIK